MHIAGIERDPLRRIRSANSVAQVASCARVRAGGGVENRLPRLASSCSHAARGDNWHIAGMEVGTEARNVGAGIDLSRRVDAECTIFLNDPAIVRDRGVRRPSIVNLHHQVRGSRNVNVTVAADALTVPCGFLAL